MTDKFRIQVLNQVSAHGLRRLPWDQFQISGDGEEPHAILLRSADLHRAVIPASVLAIGRAGAGTNNIPVAALSARGVPVFNAPGANANAVKELVLAGMLLAARNLEKSALLYDYLDGGDFYANPVAKPDRSRMNVPFTLADPGLDADFLAGAAERGLTQLKGHRSVGGMRASLYNAMPLAGVQALVAYLADFANEKG